MRVHHLSCGTMCPVGGRLMDGLSRGLTAKLVCHCLLIETEAGLVLVDTGFGLRDVRTPVPRLDRLFVALVNARLREADTALRQVEALGFRAEDVRHIVLTHLDFDHAGGIGDFPRATVHVFAEELDAARRRRGLLAHGRYRPMQWEGVRFAAYRPGGEPWFGFEAVRALDGLPPEILLVPLRGHTFGHCGVAVDTGSFWLLHAGDAYFFRGEMDPARPRGTPGLDVFQAMMEVDRASRLANQDRLRRLAHERGDGLRLFCAHDAIELRAMQARSREAHSDRSDAPHAAGAFPRTPI